MRAAGALSGLAALAVLAGAGSAVVGGMGAKWLAVAFALAAAPLFLAAFGSLRRLLLVALVFSLAMQIDLTIGNRPGLLDPRPGIPLSLTTLLLLAAAGDLLRRVGREGRLPALVPSVTLPWLALVAWAALGLTWAHKPELVAYRLPLAFEGLLLLWVAAQFAPDGREARVALGAMAAAAAVSGLFAVLQYLLETPLDLAPLGEVEDLQFRTGRYARVTGLWNNPNNLAFFLVGFLPACLLGALRGGAGWLRWLAGAGFFLGLAGLVLTQSRGGWISTLIASALAAALAFRTLAGGRLRRRLLTLGAGLAALAFLLVPVVAYRLEQDVGSMAGRGKLAETSLKVIAAHPLAGTGLDNYRWVVPWYDPNPGLRPDGSPEPVHNIYLHIGAELGLPALAVFLLALGLCLGRGARSLTYLDGDLLLLGAGALAGLAGTMVHGLGELGTLGHPKLRTLSFLGGLLLALWVAVERMKREVDGVGRGAGG